MQAFRGPARSVGLGPFLLHITTTGTQSGRRDTPLNLVALAAVANDSEAGQSRDDSRGVEQRKRNKGELVQVRGGVPPVFRSFGSRHRGP
jgi:hypothetical protein